MFFINRSQRNGADDGTGQSLLLKHLFHGSIAAGFEPPVGDLNLSFVTGQSTCFLPLTEPPFFLFGQFFADEAHRGDLFFLQIAKSLFYGRSVIAADGYTAGLLFGRGQEHKGCLQGCGKGGLGTDDQDAVRVGEPIVVFQQCRLLLNGKIGGGDAELAVFLLQCLPDQRKIPGIESTAKLRGNDGNDQLGILGIIEFFEAAVGLCHGEDQFSGLTVYLRAAVKALEAVETETFASLERVINLYHLFHDCIGRRGNPQGEFFRKFFGREFVAILQVGAIIKKKLRRKKTWIFCILI